MIDSHKEYKCLLGRDYCLFFLLVTIDLILYICSGFLFFAEDRNSLQLVIAIMCAILAVVLSLFIVVYYYRRLERNCADCVPDCAYLDCIDCDSDGVECCGVDCN